MTYRSGNLNHVIPPADVSDARVSTNRRGLSKVVYSEEHSSLTCDTSGHQNFFDGFFSSMFLTGLIIIGLSSSVVHSIIRHAPGGRYEMIPARRCCVRRSEDSSQKDTYMAT